MHIFSVRRIKMFVKEMRTQYLDSDNRMPICLSTLLFKLSACGARQMTKEWGELNAN
jgi:hypothetical protein